MSWIVKFLAGIVSFIITMTAAIGFAYVVRLLSIDPFISGFIDGTITTYLYLAWWYLFSAIWDD